MTGQAGVGETGADDTRAAEAWIDRVVAAFRGPAEPVDDPTGVIVLGQPGSGRGVAVGAACAYFADRACCMVVDWREACGLHPDHATGCEDAGVQGVLEAAARRACAASVEHAREASVNLVVTSPPEAPSLAADLRRAGYRVIVVMMCTDLTSSWEAEEIRANRLAEASAAALPASRTAHDSAHAAAIADVLTIGASSAADEIHFLTREGVFLGSLTSETGFSTTAILQHMSGHTISPMPVAAEDPGGEVGIEVEPVEVAAAELEGVDDPGSVTEAPSPPPARQVDVDPTGGSRRIRITLPNPPPPPPQLAPKIEPAPETASKDGGRAPAPPTRPAARRIQVVAPKRPTVAPDTPPADAPTTPPEPLRARPSHEASPRPVQPPRGLPPETIEDAVDEPSPQLPLRQVEGEASRDDPLIRHRLDQIARIRAQADTA